MVVGPLRMKERDSKDPVHRSYGQARAKRKREMEKTEKREMSRKEIVLIHS